MLRRLRKGEWLAVAGLVGLLVSGFLTWFSPSIDADCVSPTTDGQTTEQLCGSFYITSVDSGWDALGRPWMDFLILVVLAVFVALVMALRAGPGRPTYGAVVSLVVAGFVTTLVTLLTAIRVLVARPGGSWESDGVRVDISAGVDVGGWIGLGALLVILVGLWIAVADDRTDAPDSAFDPPAPRPVPDVATSSAGDAPAPTPEA